MSQIQICLSYLQNLETRIRSVELELSRVSSGAAPGVPSTPEVNKELSKLHNRWSGRRKELSSGLQDLAQGIREIRQSFETVDRELAESVRSSGSSGSR